MAILETFLVLSLTIFLVPTGAKTCESSRCPSIRSPSFIINPTVQFPFRLKSQHDRCGYPGFDLSCNEDNQTIISMSSGGKFAVNSIGYRSQSLQVNDPKNCMAARYLVDFSVDFPFKLNSLLYYQSFTYFNCSIRKNVTDLTDFLLTRYTCLGGPNYTVAAMLTAEYDSLGMKLPCRVIKRGVMVPYSGFRSGLNDDVSISWDKPECADCARQLVSCEFKGKKGNGVKCSGASREGIPIGAKFCILIGAGVIGLTFLSLLAYLRGRQDPTTASAAATTHAAARTVVTTGMSRSAIEMYPKRTLGSAAVAPGSRGGAKSACPICLCEYEPDEVVRVIPDCDHYFHVNCIDLWLQRNATCPLCRSPQVFTAVNSY